MRIPTELIEAQALLAQYQQETTISKIFELQRLINAKAREIITVVYSTKNCPEFFEKHDIYIRFIADYQATVDKKMLDIEKGNELFATMAKKMKQTMEQDLLPAPSHPAVQEMSQRVARASEEGESLVRAGELQASKERSEAMLAIVQAVLQRAADTPTVSTAVIEEKDGGPVPKLPPSRPLFAQSVSEIREKIIEEDSCCGCVGTLFKNATNTFVQYLGL